jgi:V8-like Glu-specific endopeptidase
VAPDRTLSHAARRAAGLLAAAASLAGLLAPAPAPAASIARADRDEQGVRGYWTPQRMRAAEPRDVLAAEAPPQTAGGAPATAAGTFVRDEIADPSQEPFRAHGKVFLTITGGSDPGDYVCSGTAVEARNLSVVWTAGHCVFDDLGGGFATNWMFAPAYKDGSTPFGGWAASELAAPQPWREQGNLKYDLGAAVVAEDAQGQALGEVVGGRGIGFNRPREQTYHAFGYPSAAPFTGERPFRCTDQLGGTDDPGGPGPNTNFITCDMTAGASGGGWVADGELLSVTSYVYCEEVFGELLCGEELYGPYQGRVAHRLYRQVSGEAANGASFCHGRRVTHLGTSAADVLVGTRGRDVFRAGGGDDTIRGRAGRDLVCAGAGRDLVRGGRDNDRLFGQRDADVLRGGRGRRDRCDGGPGRDRDRGCERRRRIP